MLEKFKKEIDVHTICHDQCVPTCPIFTIERKTTVYPSRKAQIARCLLTGEVNWDNDSAELFYHCCGCRQCMVSCVYLKDPKDPVPIFQAARYEAMKKGIKLDFVEGIEEKLNKYENIYGDLSANLESIIIENKSFGDSKILYLIDDETLALSLEAAKATVKLMNSCGIKPFISDMLNTGIDVKVLGFFDLAQEIAKKMTEYLNKQDVEKIVVSNPKAYYALKVWYKELGLEIKKEVELETSYLYDLLIERQGVLTNRPNNIPNFMMMDKVGTYQDGSYMARYIMEYDKPRKLIKPLFRHYKEMRTNRKYAVPAAPANYPLGLPKSTVEGITKLRIVDILDVKADYVITSDPLTYDALIKYWDKNKVLSVSEVLLMNYVSNAE